ncbi:MAG: trypsin-like peptidase domain-containing protein [Planctomycetota bacterium]
MESDDAIRQVGLTPVRGALRKWWNLKSGSWAGTREFFTPRNKTELPLPKPLGLRDIPMVLLWALSRVAAFGLITLLAGGGLCSVGGCRRETPSLAADVPSDAPHEHSTAAASPADLSESFRTAVEKVLPAVVQIVSRESSPNDMWSHHGHSPVPFGVDEKAVAGESSSSLLGCGVIVDAAGTVLTNHHVVESAGAMSVQTADGRQLDVRRVASDAHSDLAVLELEPAEPLPAARLGDSHAMRIGDWVLTIGSPLDLGPTVSAGIISATDRVPKGARQVPLLQTDAAINPGSSGGALVNLAGELVGITTAIASRDGGFQGIGFAIPAETAQWVTSRLREHPVVPWSDIGVLTAAAPRAGALLVRVDPHAAGHAGGLRERDVVVAVNGRAIENHIDFRRIMPRQAVGAPCTLDVIRDGVKRTHDVVPQRLAAVNETDPWTEPLESEPDAVVYSVELQLAVADLGAAPAADPGPRPGRGVRIVSIDPDGPAFHAGLRQAMTILRVGDRVIENPDDFAEALENESVEDGIVLGVQDLEGTREIRVATP